MDFELASVTKLATKWGEFNLHLFQLGGEHHLALSYGILQQCHMPLVRIHSECLTGDALFSQRCDCGSQLESAMSSIASEGVGLLIYLRQEGRGIGLINKIKAYGLQDQGLDTVDANLALGLSVDARVYDVCSLIFSYFSVKKIRLITNNPLKINAVKRMGLEVLRVKSKGEHVEANLKYLKTKVEKLGHLT